MSPNKSWIDQSLNASKLINILGKRFHPESRTCIMNLLNKHVYVPNKSRLTPRMWIVIFISKRNYLEISVSFRLNSYHFDDRMKMELWWAIFITFFHFFIILKWVPKFRYVYNFLIFVLYHLVSGVSRFSTDIFPNANLKQKDRKHLNLNFQRFWAL